jgi:hypothetical protein
MKNADLCCDFQSTRCVAPLIDDVMGYLEFQETAQKLKQSKQATPAFEREVLFQARQARRKSRLLIAHFLLYVKRLKNTNRLEQIYRDAIARFSQSGRVSLKEMIEQLETSEEIKRLIKESQISSKTIDTFRKKLGQIEAYVEVDGEHLTVWHDDGQVTIAHIDSNTETEFEGSFNSDKFDDLAEGFALHGRFLYTVIPEPTVKKPVRRVVGLLDIFANSSVGMMREFDRQVRELEDTGGLAIQSGGNGGAAAVAIILFIAALASKIAAAKIDDPGWKAFFYILAALLAIAAGIAAAEAGASVSACRPDPSDPSREFCGPVGGRTPTPGRRGP